MLYDDEEFREVFEKAIEENKDSRYTDTIKIRSFIEKQCTGIATQMLSKSQILDMALYLATELTFMLEPDVHAHPPSDGVSIDIIVDGKKVEHHYNFHEVGQNVVLRFGVQKDVCLDFIEFPKPQPE